MVSETVHVNTDRWYLLGQVITQKSKEDKTLEPYEEAVIEVPETHMGGVVDLMGSRKGQMVDMSASAEGLNRVTYVIPTRGLLGLRNSILTATKVRTALATTCVATGHSMSVHAQTLIMTMSWLSFCKL